MKLNKINIKINSNVYLKIHKTQLLPYIEKNIIIKNIPDFLYYYGTIIKITKNKEGCIININFPKYNIQNKSFIYFCTNDGIYHNAELI